MSKLYELTGQYLAVSALADDPDFPIESIQDTLKGIEGEIEIKAQSLLQVTSNMDGDIAAIDNEIKRLQARKTVINNRKQSLRDYLFRNMMETGINKIDCPLFSITLARPKPMVVINDESAIPDNFIKTTVKKAPVKADILKALKAGEDVPGCMLGETKRALIIK